MRNKVSRVTRMLLHEGGGDAEMTARLFANFASQRVVKPFVKSTKESVQQQFGENVLATLSEAKKVTRKKGCPTDILRRHILVAGSPGPLSPHPVSVVCCTACVLSIIIFIFCVCDATDDIAWVG